jgi:hypothetical protein
VSYFGESGFHQVLPGGGKALMVHRGGNKASRFLQVGIYIEGGRKGVICIPEGRSGNGWRRFVNELRQFLSSKEKGLDPEVSRIPHAAGLHSRRSFADVIRAVQLPQLEMMVLL